MCNLIIIILLNCHLLYNLKFQMHYNLHLYSCLSSTPFIQCMVSVKVTVTHENNHILDKTFTLDIPMSNTFSYQTLTNF